MRTLHLLTFLFLGLNSFSADIGGIINQYSKVLADGGCLNSIKVANPDLFVVNEEVIIIQMQGAVIDESNSASFGTVNQLNNTGNFERAIILEIVGDTVYFNHDLVNNYDFSAKVQMVSFPKYQGASITSTLTCQPWNGETGGVLAFINNGNTTFHDSIDVSGKGFRGGKQYEGSGNSCSWITASSNFYYPDETWEAAAKGEGIAISITGKEFGKGPLANGGGGGNDHNSGGAGGANATAGGKGGENNDPALFSCVGYHPGIGGKGLSYANNVAFMGGGGGAGHGNNNLSSGGANGGGIVIFYGNGISGAHQIINTNGDNANNTGGGDGAGAGGAGGTVLLHLNNLGTDLKVNANGGNGGSVDDEFYNRCHGPGGGGAGGVIRSSISLSDVSININGGSAGYITNSTAGCNNTKGGAADGNTGIQQETLTIPMGETDVECLITSATLIRENLIKVYPNPTSSFFQIQNLETIKSIVVFNARGQLVETVTNKTSFGENLPSGVYFVKVNSNNGTQNLRVIKTK